MKRFLNLVVPAALLLAVTTAPAHETGDPDHDNAPASHATIKTSGDKRVIDANGLPDHKPGQFPNRGNPNEISAQKYHFEMPLKPKAAEESRPLRGYLFGVAVNGVVFDPGTAEIWQPGDKVVSRPGPGTRMGPDVDRSKVWNYQGMGRMNLGIDSSHAHVQPTGAYHYHGLPIGLIDRLKKAHKEESGDTMLLIGYAADGFPFYAEYGHEKADDAKSPLKKLTSSYHMKKGNRPTGDKGPGGKYDGTFEQDFEFVKGGGDLDKSNGRTGVTPEYPDGTYYYVATADYPFIPRFFHGTPDSSFEKHFGPPPGGPGGPDGPPGRRGRRGPPPLPGDGPPLREGRANRPPVGATVATPAEAKRACDSQEGLGKMLERRWPISAIKEFCILERRHNPHYQLLVLDSDVVWRGTIHSGESTGFDRIEWSATTSDGRAEAYSILVKRGHDLWELELGSEQELTHSPNLNPDPKRTGFANHRKPLKDTLLTFDSDSPPPPK